MKKIKVVNRSSHPLPEYKSELAAGMDLVANLESPVILEPMERKLIGTGLSIELPENYEAQIRPRSGLAFKHGITVLNSPGTIDADYRGEVKVLLINLSKDSFTIEDGERIAQMIISPCEQAQWEPVEKLTDTVRNEGGFGSTGKN